MATTRRPDITRRAIARQIEAMGAASFDVGIFDRASGSMLNRTYGKADLLIPKHLNYLKALNARGRDIYIRPATACGQNDGLILLDDVGVGTLAQLERDGLKPAVVARTSNANFQAWIRVSDRPLSPKLATEIARILAERHNADLASADWRHYGRLAGFTNRKPEYAWMGKAGKTKHPFVLLESYAGGLAVNGGSIVAEARQRLQSRDKQSQKYAPGLQRFSNLPHDVEKENQLALSSFRTFWPRFQAEFGNDASRVDWHTCKALAKAGYSEQAIHHALRYGSPDLEARKKQHVAGKKTAYVDITVTKVLTQPDVMAARAQFHPNGR